MTDVAIGLLKVDKNVFGGDTTNREQQFSMTVMQANSALKAIAAGGVRIFVAPEYFWPEYGQIGKRILQTGPLAMDRPSFWFYQLRLQVPDKLTMRPPNCSAIGSVQRMGGSCRVG